MRNYLERFVKAAIFGAWSVACAIAIGIIAAAYGDMAGSMLAIFLITGSLYYLMGD